MPTEHRAVVARLALPVRCLLTSVAVPVGGWAAHHALGAAVPMRRCGGTAGDGALQELAPCPGVGWQRGRGGGWHGVGQVEVVPILPAIRGVLLVSGQTTAVTKFVSECQTNCA